MFRTGRGNHPSHRSVERQLTHEITGGCRIQSGICMAWHTAPVPLSQFHQGFVKHTTLRLSSFYFSRHRIAATLARICSKSFEQDVKRKYLFQSIHSRIFSVISTSTFQVMVFYSYSRTWPNPHDGRAPSRCVRMSPRPQRDTKLR